MKELLSILKAIKLPFAYDHFARGECPRPPFICYLLPNSDNFAADGIAYFVIKKVRIELYTDLKNPGLEERIEAVLTKHDTFYSKNEVWIEDEKLYEVAYEFEMPV